MDYVILATHNIEFISMKAFAFHLSNAARKFMEAEMGISLDLKQAMLFSKTPEFQMLCDVAPPPPARTMNITPEEIKALSEYWGFKAFLESKK